MTVCTCNVLLCPFIWYMWPQLDFSLARSCPTNQQWGNIRRKFATCPFIKCQYAFSPSFREQGATTTLLVVVCYSLNIWLIRSTIVAYCKWRNNTVRYLTYNSGYSTLTVQFKTWTVHTTPVAVQNSSTKLYNSFHVNSKLLNKNCLNHKDG